MTGCLQTQAEFNLTEFGKLCFDTTYNWDLANCCMTDQTLAIVRYSQDTEKYHPQIDKIIRLLTFDDDSPSL